MAVSKEDLEVTLTASIKRVYNKHRTEFDTGWRRLGYKGTENNTPLPVEVRVGTATPGSEYPYSCRIDVMIGGYQLVKFGLEHYPACCAMVQCNGFTYNRVLSETFVHDTMDALLTSLRANWYGNLARVVFNFVEPQNGRETLSGKYYSYGEIPKEPTDPNWMHYKYLYTWATSKRHQELLTVNHNTSNIIHFVDCMWTLPKD